MELSLQPDIYVPSIDDNGKYIDIIPNKVFINNIGIKCPCCTRINKVYQTRVQFSSHIKTKTHNEWLQKLSKEHLNYYSQVQEQLITLQNQKIIIANFEKEIANKNYIIETLITENKKLTKQTTKNKKPKNQINLIDL